MRVWPAQLIGGLWLLWLIYWVIAALRTKPTREHEPAWARMLFLLVMLIVAVLLAAHRWPGVLRVRLIGGGWLRYWIAVSLIVAGLAFSIWARVVLAGNWSGWVTVKEGHELMQSGPYARIRHPIYTGILLALFGTGLAAAQVRGLVAFVIACCALLLKSRVEERVMQREFGERYSAYRARTWALIPFVF
ncbi:MAG TPA: isoprenylcysteine carboxylmethyltransferase family protein [Steroidobacteraceae bacterium]|nr:isoprenylcysteine carboxylmethyltransferase family protein [Steroidobacteraceae bacterium]